MKPTICRQCGEPIQQPNPDNVNVCLQCNDWSDTEIEPSHFFQPQVNLSSMGKKNSLWNRIQSRFRRVTHKDLMQILKDILMTEQEAIDKINTLTSINQTQTTALVKIQQEIQKVLDTRPPAGELSAEFEAALNALETSNTERNAQQQIADDKIPDEPVPPVE